MRTVREAGCRRRSRRRRVGGPWLLAVGGSELGLTGGGRDERLQPRGRSRKASDQRRSSENIRACSWPDADAQNISADDGERDEVGVAREKRRSEGDMGEMNGRDACGRWREARTGIARCSRLVFVVDDDRLALAIC